MKLKNIGVTLIGLSLLNVNRAYALDKDTAYNMGIVYEQKSCEYVESGYTHKSEINALTLNYMKEQYKDDMQALILSMQKDGNNLGNPIAGSFNTGRLTVMTDDCATKFNALPE